MTGLAEFIADALGLLCATASWMFMCVLPVGFFTLAQMSETRSPSLAAAESLIGISIGLLALWLANGILKRGRVRIALTCLLCVFVGLRKIVSSLAGPAPNIYLVAQAFLAASLFFAAALFLGVVLFRKKEVKIMTFEDLTKSFEALLDSLLEWLDTCRHPLTHCDEVLSLGSDKEKINKSLRLWLIIFLITVILQFPLLKTAGIEWSDAGFHLPYFLALTMAFILNGVTLHWGMRIYGIQSNIADTLGAYTTLVGVYGPFFTLALYPESVLLFATLKGAKGQGLPFIPAVSLVLKRTTLSPPGQRGSRACCFPFWRSLHRQGSSRR